MEAVNVARPLSSQSSHSEGWQILIEQVWIDISALQKRNFDANVDWIGSDLERESSARIHCDAIEVYRPARKIAPIIFIALSYSERRLSLRSLVQGRSH